MTEAAERTRLRGLRDLSLKLTELETECRGVQMCNIAQWMHTAKMSVDLEAAKTALDIHRGIPQPTDEGLYTGL